MYFKLNCIQNNWSSSFLRANTTSLTFPAILLIYCFNSNITIFKKNCTWCDAKLYRKHLFWRVHYWEWIQLPLLSLTFYRLFQFKHCNMSRKFVLDAKLYRKHFDGFILESGFNFSYFPCQLIDCFNLFQLHRIV